MYVIIDLKTFIFKKNEKKSQVVTVLKHILFESTSLVLFDRVTF